MSDRGQVPEMGVTITATPVLGSPDRRSRTAEALAHMAQRHGFVDATADQF